MKTYLWIMATAYSKDSNSIMIILEGKKISWNFSLIPLKREISKWPAIIFAARRTERVIGRIKFLIVSIKTIKEDNSMGVPEGTKWENMWLVFLIHPNNMKIIQNGMARDILIRICLVAVKMYGNKPKKLLSIINMNRDCKKYIDLK